jgi:hypothetical protein
MRLENISQKLAGFSTIGITLAALVVFLVFSVLVLPRQSAMMEAYSGDLGSPDLSFVYSPADLYTMAEGYGADGRDSYVRARFSFDLIFPVIYTLFLLTSISRVLSALFPSNSCWGLLNLMPIGGMALDLLENIAASIVISRYPLPAPFCALLAPIFTFFKWVFVGGSFLILLMGVLVLLFNQTKKQL